jgi:hypothetical protein
VEIEEKWLARGEAGTQGLGMIRSEIHGRR